MPLFGYKWPRPWAAVQRHSPPCRSVARMAAGDIDPQVVLDWATVNRSYSSFPCPPLRQAKTWCCMSCPLRLASPAHLPSPTHTPVCSTCRAAHTRTQLHPLSHTFSYSLIPSFPSFAAFYSSLTFVSFLSISRHSLNNLSESLS